MSQGQAALDPRTPVVVAVGQVEQRTTDLAAALEPVALLAEAARAAQADSGTDRLLGAVDTVAVIHILSHRYADPGRLVAAELGIEPGRTIATDDGGNYPQSLLNRACAEIAAGTQRKDAAEDFRHRERDRAGDTAAPRETGDVRAIRIQRHLTADLVQAVQDDANSLRRRRVLRLRTSARESPA